MFVVAASLSLSAQQVVRVGGGSYASFVPLSESATSQHGGSQAYMMEHRTIYVPDSLLARLGNPNGTPGTLVLPSNDWWTYALIGQWTGKIWVYPGWVEAKNSEVQVGFPTYWEPTGCEMKWDTPLSISFDKLDSKAALVDAWSDYHMSFIMQDGDKWVRTTCVHGSPLVWIEAEGVTPKVTNPDSKKYAVYSYNVGSRAYVTIALLTNGLNAADVEPYAFRIPTSTKIDYIYTASKAELTTTFRVNYRDVKTTTANGVLQGFLPHHYYNTTLDAQLSTLSSQPTYATPRGEMRLARGNNFTITYPVHSMLPFFAIPDEELSGYNPDKLKQLCADYAARGTFGADTYWGGKGLTQMMHYMTAAMQLGDTATFRLAKQRLRENLENWYTYTPGEKERFFAYYPRWGAMVGFDPSYDSDTFNDHHFHYGYFIYASAVLCMLDEDFKAQYGAMAREVARDYANWTRPGDSELPEPWFRTLDPYCGHSFAGGMGNQGNGNGQESTSEAMQGWGGIWMLGAALGDEDMLSAGVFGYTLESRATAEYWFDRGRRNIDYTKYKHPWCCNLTMQGVGWWTWFSGDPVWMHSIQWLPISPVLSNYLSEDREFARWDYTEMYAKKEVGNYEAPEKGLGDESGLGNVCLSYLAIFDADSAARVWDNMDRMGKALAKNPDTGGITYLFAHSLRSYGNQRHDIYSDSPLAAAYDKDGVITYMVFNPGTTTKSVRFFGAVSTTVEAKPQSLTIVGKETSYLPVIVENEEDRPKDPIAESWTHSYPNVALKKAVTVSSEENAGCLAKYLTDGDVTTRWGSAHKDGEWAIVDLAEMYYIDHLVLRWEPAYASEVEIALSEDKKNWSAVTCSGTGGVQRINLASLMMDQSYQSRGRYIRLTGLKRATSYGTSLYELEAYGLPLVGDASQVIALEITSEVVSLVPGETPSYEVHGYNYLGTALNITPTLTPTITADQYTLTATYQGLKAVYTWPILEQVLTVGASVTPSEVTLAPGDTQVFTIVTVDQFGYPMETTTATYTATEVGDFTVPFSLGAFQATATVHVVPFINLNLALGKPTTASGEENDGTLGFNATDGDLKTRWSSRFMDEEWLQVDLLDTYWVNRVNIVWEASYATVYDILLSEDNVHWDTAYSKVATSGGTHTIRFCPVYGRYLRLVCHKRSTGYGSSLYELEVYGVTEPNPEDPYCGELPEEKGDGQTWYAQGTNGGVEFVYYLVYNEDRTVSVFTEIHTEHTGLAASSWSIDGEWKDMSKNEKGLFTRTSIKKFDIGSVLDCFFYQPYTGGAARLDFKYVVGSSNQPPVVTDMGDTSIQVRPFKKVENGVLYIVRNHQWYSTSGQLIR